MLKKLVHYFANHHLLNTFIVIFVFLGAIFAWDKIGKEEYPNIDLGFVRISTSYPGASSEDVEKLVTKPLEEAIAGIDGLYEVKSSSSTGTSSISIFLENGLSDSEKNEAVLEIRNEIMNVSLPTEVTDDPKIKVYKTSKKAVIDVGVYHKDRSLLDTESRRKLQHFAHALENQIKSLSSVGEINSSQGYLKQEIQVLLKPKKLKQFNISISTIQNQIKKHHILKPAGTLENTDNSKITVLAELDQVDKLKKLVIRGTFDSPAIRLHQVADVKDSFEKGSSIRKINGHEGIRYTISKKSSADILNTTDQIRQCVNNFKKNVIQNEPIKVVLLDDESRDVRNRLSLIQMNGLLGFILILITLFIFLDFKSALWVAMGIPFTFSFTLILVYLMGYTINNITLAAFIIVMGIVVDDAIVIAENVHRYQINGYSLKEASEQGTVSVFLPILASIITTCAAFVPLFFFSGRFINMIKFIPPIIFLMLFSSLFESTLILPGHLKLKLPNWVRYILSFGILFLIDYFQKKKHSKRNGKESHKEHFFNQFENFYSRILQKLLKHHWVTFLFFGGLLVFSMLVFKSKMRFVMFPREEVKQLFFVAEAPAGTTKKKTALLAQPIEDMFKEYLGTEVTGFRTSIAVSRRGGAVEENKMNMNIELVDKEKRKKSAKQLLKEWKKKLKNIKGFKKKYFARRRFGHSSGSPIEVVIQENNDKIRRKVADTLASEMKKYAVLKNVEIEKPMLNNEFKIHLRRHMLTRLRVEPDQLASAFRTILEGTILYDVLRGDEDVNVKLSVVDREKTSIKSLLAIPVKNSSDYLVPIKNLVRVKKVKSPNAVNRFNQKRTTFIYSDINEQFKKTPIEVANYLENKIFPKIWKKYPAVMLSFSGEIKETRESTGDLMLSVFAVLLLIFFILALLFDSLVKPFIIMLSIPFGVVGVILVFYLHEIFHFGLFTAIGTLGLAGVVVNDAIVLLDKLDKDMSTQKEKGLYKKIAEISKTRLKAVLLTTITTVAGVMPTAYGVAGYDSMLAEMMLALSWGLVFGTLITLVLIPSSYSLMVRVKNFIKRRKPLIL